RAKSACIQCSNCTQLCPRHLLGHPLEPHKIMRKMAMGGDPKNMLDDPVIQSAALCCECGICEVYACPMGLNPRKINAILKGELREEGIRYERKGDSWTPSPEREVRKAPTDKVAARAGVYRYNKLVIDRFVEYDGR
ncbi:MAG: 4Fe-4S dicluster domain-containing protein, partial [Firmicutes bacterium]|nr:4Fe-4S dicluster domain-containing protein [Bacillota bacterium]